MLWFSENRALALGEKCSGSRRTVLWLSVNCSPTEMFSSSPNIWIVCLKLKISIYLRWEPKLHFVETCGESIRQIKRNNCIRGNKIGASSRPACCTKPNQSRTVSFPSGTLIYGISRNGSKNINIRTCEHVILGQLRI